VTQQWLQDGGGTPPSWYTRLVLAGDAAVARAVDRTIVVAPPLRDFLVRRLRVPAGKVVHIDNGLVLPPAVVRERPVRSLLFVGLLVERKGVHLLLEALAAGPPDLTLDVVGDGPERAALEALATRLGLIGRDGAGRDSADGDRVRFLGFRADVPELLARADAFVLPSLMEQQPLVLIEAMGAGLPIVATRVGGVEDLVGEPRTGQDHGLLVPAGDARALAGALTRLAALDVGQVSALGGRAAQRARERFSLETCLEHHLSLYAQLCDANAKSGSTTASGMASPRP
jgi:glycosyltransferase involved in cell wall biosynthesis